SNRPRPTAASDRSTAAIGAPAAPTTDRPKAKSSPIPSPKAIHPSPLPSVPCTVNSPNSGIVAVAHGKNALMRTSKDAARPTRCAGAGFAALAVESILGAGGGQLGGVATIGRTCFCDHSVPYQ